MTYVDEPDDFLLMSGYRFKSDGLEWSTVSLPATLQVTTENSEADNISRTVR